MFLLILLLAALAVVVHVGRYLPTARGLGLRQRFAVLFAVPDLGAVTLTNPAELPLTIPLWPHAAEILGMGRSTAYDLAKRGEFPVRLLRIGNKYRVSRADLLRYLGETPPEAA